MVPQTLILPALKRGLLPLYTATDLKWPWLDDALWIQSKSEQEALQAAYEALPDIARAVLSFTDFAAKATPAQIAAGMRVANQHGQKAAGLIMPSQVAALRFVPRLEVVDWLQGMVALSLSPKWLKSLADSQLCPVQYGGPGKGSFIGWQNMPSEYAQAQELRWLAPKSSCLQHNQRYWLKLPKQALTQVVVVADSQVANGLAPLLKTDQRYRHVRAQHVAFDPQKFSWQPI